MPIYEYKCPKCEKKFELMRSFSQANEPAVCECGHKKSPRILSLFASFSTSSGGVSTPLGGGGGCGGCSSSNCGTCGS